MNDSRLRIYGQLLIVSITVGCYYLESVTREGISFWRLLLYVAASTFVVWESLRQLIRLARRARPRLEQTRSRLLLTAAGTLVVVALVPFLRFRFGDLIQLYGPAHTYGGTISIYSYLRVLGQNIFYCLFIAATYEALYYQRLSLELAARTRQLEKDRLEGQLESFRAQLSPHFLFNSLNTLSSLVPRDPVLAGRFIEELAQVYRYLLDMSAQPDVSLDEELRFARAYVALLETRFGGRFRVHFDIPEACGSWRLPPLTLQLLIENAVKHNKASRTEALELSVSADTQGFLVVQNPLRPRTDVAGSGKGLAAIRARYALLGTAGPEVRTGDGFFTVTLPLIQTETYAGADC